MILQLRDYQINAFDSLRANIKRNIRRQLLCLPTGGGKTIVAIALIKSALEKGSKAAFVADRSSLVHQTSRMLQEYGIPHGVAMGDTTFGRSEPVQICTAQTLEKRGFWPDIKLLIVDEAHTQRKKTLEFMKNSNVITVGLTATPFSTGLGKHYQVVVNACTTEDLIRDQWVVPVKVYCATSMDMEQFGGSAEWTDEQAEKGAIPIIGDIVNEWIAGTHREFGKPVKTLVFAPTIPYGRELAAQFQSAGYSFETCGGDDPQERIDALRENQIQGLITCEKLAKGFDDTSIQCLVIARPYRNSLAAHIQILGRGMRAHFGDDIIKKFCLVNDHARNYARFASQTELFWKQGFDDLDKGAAFASKSKKKQQETDRQCYNCGFFMPEKARDCPSCGTTRRQKRSRVHTMAGKMKKYEAVSQQIRDFWPHICRLAVDRYPSDPTRQLRWARVQHKDLTGNWPSYGRPIQPNTFCDIRIEDMVKKNIRKWWKLRKRKQ